MSGSISATSPIPIYNLATREDHIAPGEIGVSRLEILRRPVKFVLAGSGHIAGVVNPPGKPKYQYWTGDAPVGNLERWLEQAAEHPGSWWPDWLEWIKQQDGATVAARAPGGGKYPPLEDAPGSYVKVRGLTLAGAVAIVGSCSNQTGSA
jgi:polyhydroxyalkanoate synthase